MHGTGASGCAASQPASHPASRCPALSLSLPSPVSLCLPPLDTAAVSVAAGALSSVAAQLCLSGLSKWVKPCLSVPCAAGQRCWVGNGLGQIEVLDVAAARFVGAVKGLAGG